MIETVEGLKNIEAIAAVNGIDVIHVGSNDLLANMGKPGKFDDPALVAAQERLIAACRKHGILPAAAAPDVSVRSIRSARAACS